VKVVQKLRKLSRSSKQQALPTRLRKKRFLLFEEMANAITSFTTTGTLSVGDFGGTVGYWDQVYDMARNPLNLDITLINYRIDHDTDNRFRYVEADVRDLASMPDKAFDISFSNSLIEHLGDLSVQARVIREMLRVSSYFYLQTPNHAFFWEPHYALPFVHWLSLPARMKALALVTRTAVREQYNAYVENPVRLLSRSELRYLFPEESFEHQPEHLFGMTKSWVVRSRLNSVPSSKSGQ